MIITIIHQLVLLLNIRGESFYIKLYTVFGMIYCSLSSGPFRQIRTGEVTEGCQNWLLGSKITPHKFNIASKNRLAPKRKLIFQPSFFGFHVKFRVCTKKRQVALLLPLHFALSVGPLATSAGWHSCSDDGLSPPVSRIQWDDWYGIFTYIEKLYKSFRHVL